MTSLLYSIAAAGILSITSLLAVLFRVSPITAPAQALPAFFASLFLSIATVGCLAAFFVWKWLPFHAWDDGRLLTVALRQAVFLAFAFCLLLLFHLLGIVTWWIALLIVTVFLLIEIAMHV